jgi:NADH-quinone oxidoreductase subunit G
MFALKLLMDALGSANTDCRQDGARIDPATGRAGYLFNPGIAGIEDADAILIVGANPRREAAVLNARIRKRWRAAGIPIFVIGEAASLTYPYTHLGSGPESLANLDAAARDALAKAERPLVLVGPGALARPDGAAVLSAAAAVAGLVGAVTETWNGFAVLHGAASRVGGLDIGFVPGEGGLDVAAMTAGSALDVVFLLGADEIDMARLGSAFVVYVGSHGDAGAHRADVILPGAAYTEKSGTFVNTEGRVQVSNRATFPPGEAREDWAIFRALSDALGKRLPFDSLTQLRAALYRAHPHLAAIDRISPADPAGVVRLAEAGGTMDRAAFQSPVTDFYLTNPIARASAVMAECSALARGEVRAAAE